MRATHPPILLMYIQLLMYHVFPADLVLTCRYDDFINPRPLARVMNNPMFMGVQQQVRWSPCSTHIALNCIVLILVATLPTIALLCFHFTTLRRYNVVLHDQRCAFGIHCCACMLTSECVENGTCVCFSSCVHCVLTGNVLVCHCCRILKSSCAVSWISCTRS